jgi:hypothetical protein
MAILLIFETLPDSGTDSVADPDPHQSDQLDPDPHKSDKLDPDKHQFINDKANNV